jgi:hypothetical protein
MAKRSTQGSCEMFERIKHSIAGGERAAEESIGAVARRIPPTMRTRPHPGHHLADAAVMPE